MMEDKDWLWSLRIEMMNRKTLETLARQVLKEKMKIKTLELTNGREDDN